MLESFISMVHCPVVAMVKNYWTALQYATMKPQMELILIWVLSIHLTALMFIPYGQDTKEH
jgi:hypothetical protein